MRVRAIIRVVRVGVIEWVKAWVRARVGARIRDQGSGVQGSGVRGQGSGVRVRCQVEGEG